MWGLWEYILLAEITKVSVMYSYKSKQLTRLSVQAAPVGLRAARTSSARSCPGIRMAAGSGTGCTPDKEEQKRGRCGSGYPPE